MKHEKAAGAEDPNKWCGEQRIDVGFAEIEPVWRGIGSADDAEVGKAAARLHTELAAALQKDPFRRREFFPDPNEVLPFERHVPVAGEAVGQAVIGRLVSLETKGRPRKVDGNRQRQEEGEPRQHRGASGAPDQALEPGGRAERRAGPLSRRVAIRLWGERPLLAGVIIRIG